MSTKLLRPTNGVSYGTSYTVTAQDVADGYVLFDFQVDISLVANIQLYDGSGVGIPLASIGDSTDTVTVFPPADAVITYPTNGQIIVANGANFTLTAGYRLDIVAQRAS